MRSWLPAIVAVLAGSLSAAAEPPRFLLACAPCHGFDGIGYDNRTPNLAGQHSDYLYAQLAAFRTGQRKHPQMNFFSGQMTQEELQAIVDYYSALPGR
jgi:cytochrome c553